MRRIICGLLLLAGCARGPAVDGDGPVIQIKEIDQPPGHVFEVSGPMVDGPRLGLTVHVVTKDGPSELAMVGRYDTEANRIVFTPRYPLTAGLRYRAIYRAPGLASPVTADIELPRPVIEPTTIVEHIYPSADVLPENLLRFYVQFSAPMARGDVYKHVHLIDDQGKEIVLPFLELDEEFWDPAQQRFTLFFDPGRIKRGVKPREDLGPALEEGRAYRLVIDRDWQDARGAPLKASYVKQFKVVAPDDQSPDPKSWQIAPPSSGVTAPLVVTFPEPLDHGMLQRLLQVVDGQGQRLKGKIAVSGGETRWEFTPAKPWTAGSYELVTATTLEDRCGNNIERPFEIDVFNPIERTVQPGEVKRGFVVR
jgi:hypothetical protein